jgi:hypothetical protein
VKACCAIVGVFFFFSLTLRRLCKCIAFACMQEWGVFFLF